MSIRYAALFLILAGLSVYYYSPSLSLFPSHIHAWTQSDRYALALGFLHNGFDFFHPQTFNLATTDGITRVDFPIHEYLVAILMKITGFQEPLIFRIYTLLYSLTGLIFLFRLAMLFASSFIKSLAAVLFIFSAPVFVYYANGFIPGVPSLANVFIGYYFFFRYKEGKARRDFLLAVFFVTLAALARSTFFIYLLAIAIQQIRDHVREKKFIKKEILALITAFAIFFVYQLYNLYLGNTYGTQFLISFLPARDWNQLMFFTSRTWEQWKLEYFTAFHYVFLGVLILTSVAFMIYRKSVPLLARPALVQFFLITGGGLLFYILMAKQFPDHDYYFIDTFYPWITILLCILMSFQFPKKWIEVLSGALLLTLMVIAVGEAKKANAKRYATANWDRVEITRQNFAGSKEFLSESGVAGDAKILVLDGYTTNVPLILMEKKGWTVNWTTAEKIRKGLSENWDVVAVQNAFLASEVVRNYPVIVQQLEKIADNGRISLYKRNPNPNRTLNEFCGITPLKSIHSNSQPDSLKIDESSEFFELLSKPGSELSGHGPVKALITGEIFMDAGSGLQLVGSVKGEDPDSYYFTYSLESYLRNTSAWQPMLFQFVLPELQAGEFAKVYIWNKEKKSYSLRNLNVQVYY